ncbi:hypothetical protein CSUI_005464, partial [Cystoisospora suis]
VFIGKDWVVRQGCSKQLSVYTCRECWYIPRGSLGILHQSVYEPIYLCGTIYSRL